jgi:hypothetical protein
MRANIMKKQDFYKIVTFDNSDYTGGIVTLYQIFQAEKGCYMGLSPASVSEWVQGLPTCLSFPFSNFDILEKTGLKPETYWKKLASYVMGLIVESKAELVGVISNIARVDTSYYGNPRYSFLLNTEEDVIRLQTEVSGSLGYSITNYNHKKVIVKTKWTRNKLCAIWAKEV